MRQFLLADSVEHAELLDKLVLAALEEQGIYGGAWSEVWTDGTQYGIYWGAPASGIFGYPPSEEYPDGDPSMVLVTEQADQPWTVVTPEPDPTDETI